MENEKTVIKELEKIGLNKNELKEQNYNMILKIENSLNEINKSNCEIINNIFKNSYTVLEVSKKLNISRQLLYRSYPESILYINSRAEYFKLKENKLLNNIYDEKNDDKIMINKLLERDVEFMEQKRKINELEKQIKTLKNENNRLNNTIKNLNNHSNIKSNYS